MIRQMSPYPEGGSEEGDPENKPLSSDSKVNQKCGLILFDGLLIIIIIIIIINICMYV